MVPLLPDDLSMGLHSDKGSFWLNLQGDKEAVENGAPASMQLSLTPWNPAMSVARPSTATYAASMGYDILALMAQGQRPYRWRGHNGNGLLSEGLCTSALAPLVLGRPSLRRRFVHGLVPSTSFADHDGPKPATMEEEGHPTHRSFSRRSLPRCQASAHRTVCA